MNDATISAADIRDAYREHYAPHPPHAHHRGRRRDFGVAAAPLVLKLELLQQCRLVQSARRLHQLAEA